MVRRTVLLFLTGFLLQISFSDILNASKGNFSANSVLTGSVLIKGSVGEYLGSTISNALVTVLKQDVATVNDETDLLTTMNTITSADGTFVLSVPANPSPNPIALMINKSSVVKPYIDQLYGSSVTIDKEYMYTWIGVVVPSSGIVTLATTIRLLPKNVTVNGTLLNNGQPISGNFVFLFVPQFMLATTNIMPIYQFVSVKRVTSNTFTEKIYGPEWYSIQIFDKFVPGIKSNFNGFYTSPNVYVSGSPMIFELGITSSGQTTNNYVARNQLTGLPYTTIQGALNAASPNAIIQLITSNILEHDVVWPDKDDISLVSGLSSDVTWVVSTTGQRHLVQNFARRWALKGIQFAYGRGDFGGSIQILTNSVSHRLTIDSCTFFFPSANYGGAIYSQGNSNQIVVSASTFNNCVAGQGGAFYQGNISVKKSFFNQCGYGVGVTANPSTTYGGVMASDVGIPGGRLFLKDSQIRNCGSNDHGGVIYQTHVELSDCIITGSYSLFGAVFSNSSVTLNRTSIIGSKVDQGGSVSWLSSMVAIHSQFVNNLDTGYQPSGIFTNGADTLINCLVVKNLSNRAIWVNNKHFLLNTTVAQNNGTPIYEASGVASFLGQNSILDGTFAAATASTNYATVTLSHCAYTGVSIPAQISITRSIGGFTASDFNSDFSLKNNSVAIGAGSVALWNQSSLNVTSDISGGSRILSSSIDLGAYQSAYSEPFTLCTVNVSGVALDSSGTPVPHVLVYLISRNNSAILSPVELVSSTYATTNASGQFGLTFLSSTKDHVLLGAVRGSVMKGFDSEMPESPNYLQTILEIVPSVSQSVLLTINMRPAVISISGQIISQDVVATGSLWVMMRHPSFGPTNNVLVDQFLVNAVRATGSYELAVLTGSCKVEGYSQFVPGDKMDSFRIYERFVSFSVNSTFDIYITSKNNVPSITALTVAPLSSQEDSDIFLTINFSDADTDTVNIVISSLLGGIHQAYVMKALSGSITYNYHSNYADQGSYTLNVSITDGRPPTGAITVSLVLSVNQVPSYTISASANLRIIGLPAGIIPTNNGYQYVAWDNTLNGGMGAYKSVSANAILPGMGVWTKITSNMLIDLTTVAQPQNRIVKLKRGWNLVSNPQPFTFEWMNCVVSYNQQTYNLPAAISYNLLYNSAYEFTGTNYVSASVIARPFVGLWIAAVQDVDFIVPGKCIALSANFVSAMDLSVSHLVLDLSVEKEDVFQGRVSLVAGNTNPLFVDQLLAPSAPGNETVLYSQKSGLNLQTCHQSLADRMEWPLVVNQQTQGNLTLRLRETVNASQQAYRYFVVDAFTQQRTPFVNGQATVFGSVGRNSFYIEAVNVQVLSSLGGQFTYPNPFNPDKGEAAKFFYNTGGSGSGTIKIYSIHGRLIRTISVSSTVAGANDGIQVWDGRDDNGVLMPNDVYFYIISLKDSTNEFKAKGKIVLWKE